ncbi:SDR family NAD(P)-dependent oxidoreductase [Planosporangium sp. 12N6]|uniref:SDR family NAD(P)-dependent oxidoreductase n=1 Tax=Planosporangium spinosum TaxID=3402278 RepID=UPI003CFBB2BB
MEDLTVVVTGASSGVGLAAAEAFARGGARVVVVGRDPGRLAEAVDRVRAAGGRAPDSVQADFNRLDDVRTLASHLADRYPTIDVLANNAGGLVHSYATTPDGFEATIQANHLAPFLLTNLLRDRLRGGRVVNTASDAHRSGPPDPDDLVGRPDRYSAWRAYGASKAANILFAAEAARRWPDVLSTSYHPGVVRSRFGAGSTWLNLFYRAAPFLVTPEAGADTLVWLATAPAEEITPGGYYAKRRLRRAVAGADDPRLAARLWEASAQAVGL